MGWIEREAEFCHRRFGYRGYRMLSRAEMREEVASACYAGGRMDEGGGHLHPLRFVLGMAAAAVRTGVRIFEDSRVERIRWGRPARVSTVRGVVEADYVILAGNAYLGDRNRAAHRIPDHADRQPRARHRTPRGAPRARAHPQRRVRARHQIRRGLLPLHGRPPPPVRRRRDLVRPPARRSEGVRPPLHAAGLPPARGREDRLRLERPARDHHEPAAARGAARPQRVLRPRVLGARGRVHPRSPESSSRRRWREPPSASTCWRGCRTGRSRVARGFATRCWSWGCCSMRCATSSECANDRRADRPRST